MSYFNQQHTGYPIANEGYQFTFNQGLYPYNYNYNYNSNYFYSNSQSPSSYYSYNYQQSSSESNSSSDSIFKYSNLSTNLSPHTPHTYQSYKSCFQNYEKLFCSTPKTSIYNCSDYQTGQTLQNEKSMIAPNYLIQSIGLATINSFNNKTNTATNLINNKSENTNHSDMSQINKKRKIREFDDSEINHDTTYDDQLKYAFNGQSKKKKKNNVSIKCNICLKEYESQASFLMHNHVSHNHQNPRTCPICSKHFQSYSGVLNHLKIHTNEKDCVCDYCGDMFTDSSALVKHIRTHTGEKPYKCKICNRQFSQSGNLSRHKKLHQKEQSKARESIVYHQKNQDQMSNQVLLSALYNYNNMNANSNAYPYL